MDPAPMTAEEESLKRNTDCIYFLASPLTCKKGALCEFRHSENARLNPRDCYYWMSGKCLNPKCAFRHPPLDGLSSHSLPLTLPTASKQIPTAIPAKQSMPCIYFQKGHCLKADRCPFSHVTQQGISTPKAFPSISENQEAQNKESWSMKQCATQHNAPNPFIDIVSKVPVLGTKPIINGFSHADNLSSKSSHVINNNARGMVHNQQIQAKILNSHEDLQNGVEPGEIVGERYRGFDANVLNNLKRQNHYDYERKHIERNDSTRHILATYERAHNVQNGSANGYYERKSQRISSEMNNMGKLRMPQRREVEKRSRSPDDVRESDLRSRLKQRKIDSSYSSRYQVSLESSRSNHVKDRVSDFDKEREASRIRGRLSPPRRYDRVKRSSEEPLFSWKLRNISSRLSKREEANVSVDFSGPKSLAELKGKKKLAGRSDVRESLVRKAVSYEEIVETAPTFEGPKPLDVLLKRKRGEVSVNSNGEAEVQQINGDGKVQENVEEMAVKEEEPLAVKEDDVNYNGESLVKGGGEEEEEEALEENEDHMEVDGVEDQDLENFDGEYEDYDENNVYEEDEGKLDGGDDDEDDDDFARKIGLIFS